ncbi:hypothetical protein GCM10022254_43670 [Actinomadura meridiana]|uniref:Uncharacterized protein n=1 Tax=Actinomadura meridiana TaxID=559626 RepID=A0ABP8C8V6_9ACTN
MNEVHEALPCALMPNAQADYIVVFEDIADFGAELGPSGDDGSLRAVVAESVYPDRADDGYRTYFRKPGYLYVWTDDERDLAGYLAEKMQVKALGDPRMPDGRTIEAQAFVQDPVPSSPPW